MKKILTLLTVFVTLSCAAQGNLPRPTVWSADYFPAIIDWFGQPQVYQTPLGPAVHFDGSGDGVFVDAVPVAGMKEFTLEVVFFQDGDAAFEQRFLHIGTMDRRILFETRVNPDRTWYFDAFVNLGTPEATPENPNPVRKSAVLIDEALRHPADRWYTLTLTASPEGLVSYVNGVEQCRSDLPWEPLVNEGFTSVGVRQNKVCWFKGSIFKVRVSPRVLAPEEFLQDHKALNGER
ncbi:MAG: LamG domain-containing protein [Bacteroidales bacterium]|nr:LamG domain-containing protein [Bacteroidales bacterium]